MDKNNFIMSYSVDKAFDSDKFLKIRCRVCHDEESPNKTYFTKETMEKANKESLEYIPILANVFTDENGKPVIGAHDTHIEPDKLNEGQNRLIYDENPIGMVPSLADNNCSIEEYNGLNYTFVDAYIWRGYANYAEQLIEDGENVKLSMEIDMEDSAVSYDATNDRYNIDAYRYRGITLLNENCGTGMKDAMATTTNFSINEDVKSKMIVLMEELKQCLCEYNTGNSDEKGVEEDMTNEETVETVMEEQAVEESVVEEVTEEVVEEQEVETQEETVEAEIFEEHNDETPENEPLVCTFRLSHDDTRYALQSLLNALCSEDSFLYIESVYDGYFYYADYFTGDAFKQAYKVRKDVVSFSGDPEKVYREFVTQSEKDELENMRKNYAELVKFKEDTETAQLQAKKDAIFADAKFASIIETKSFKKLIENSKDYTVEECEQKANDILEDFSSFAMNFAANDNKSKTVGFVFKQDQAENKPYGDLFD